MIFLYVAQIGIIVPRGEIQPCVGILFNPSHQSKGAFL